MNTTGEADVDVTGAERRDEGGDAFRRLLAHPVSPPVALALPLGLVKPVEAAIEPPRPAKEPVIQSPADSREAQPASDFSNPLLGLLAKGETDIIGLIAYGYYKLSKRDWLSAFRDAHQRQPNDAELRAFIIGEQMPRRIAGYRRQAEAALGEQAASAPTDLRADREAEPEATPERPRMATILHQLTRKPLDNPIPTVAGRRMANGRSMPAGQPNLGSLFRYLLILAGLVICLAILVNYAKSTVFLN